MRVFEIRISAVDFNYSGETIPAMNTPSASSTTSKTLPIILGIFGAAVLFIVIICGVWISTSNTEISLRNAITAKQRDNQSELDNLQKKIAQTGQVTQAQMSAIKDIVVGNSQVRSANGSGSMATLVREAVPTIDVGVYKQLINVISSSRDAFTMRQKEILDLKREHDNIRTTFPGSFIVGSRPEIQVQIVTSDRAEQSFSTGKDSDIKVF